MLAGVGEKTALLYLQVAKGKVVRELQMSMWGIISAFEQPARWRALQLIPMCTELPMLWAGPARRRRPHSKHAASWRK